MFSTDTLDLTNKWFLMQLVTKERKILKIPSFSVRDLDMLMNNVDPCQIIN